MNKLIQSSGNPANLSLTIQGVLVGIAPVVIGIFKVMDIPLTDTDLTLLIQSITALASAILVVIGVVRKFINAFRSK